MPDTNSPSTDGFDPSDINTNLVKSVIALPLLKEIQKAPRELHDVIIDINNDYWEGRITAKENVIRMAHAEISNSATSGQSVKEYRSRSSQQYVYARLEGEVIQSLAVSGGTLLFEWRQCETDEKRNGAIGGSESAR